MGRFSENHLILVTPSAFLCVCNVFMQNFTSLFFTHKRAGAGRYEMSTLDHRLRTDSIYNMVVVKSIALD